MLWGAFPRRQASRHQAESVVSDQPVKDAGALPCVLGGRQNAGVLQRFQPGQLVDQLLGIRLWVELLCTRFGCRARVAARFRQSSPLRLPRVRNHRQVTPPFPSFEGATDRPLVDRAKGPNGGMLHRAGNTPATPSSSTTPRAAIRAADAGPSENAPCPTSPSPRWPPSPSWRPVLSSGPWSPPGSSGGTSLPPSRSSSSAWSPRTGQPPSSGSACTRRPSAPSPRSPSPSSSSPTRPASTPAACAPTSASPSACSVSASL